MNVIQTSYAIIVLNEPNNIRPDTWEKLEIQVEENKSLRRAVEELLQK